VTMVIGRSAKLLVTGALGALLLAGCASGPGQAGSAAIVDGNAISLDTIQTELNSYLTNQPPASSGSQQQSPAQEARLLLSYAVMHQVDNAAVAKYGLTIPAQAVSQYADELGGVDQLVKGSGFTSDEVQSILRDRVAEMAYASKYLARFQVTFDSVTVADQKTATALAQKLGADPANARANLQAAAAANNGQAQFGTKLTGGQIFSQQKQFEDQAQQSGGSSASSTVLPLLAAKSNSVLSFPFAQGQWVVLVVHDANTNGTPSSADQSALSQATSDDLYQSGTYLLSTFAQGLGIRISPRYGVWDAVGMEVVGTPDQGGIEVASKGNTAS
jgi:hypothetical protein